MTEPVNVMRRLMWGRREAYRACFEGADKKVHQAGLVVLSDLFHLCGQGKSLATGKFDPQVVLVHEGKRQLYLHILSMLRAEDEDLWRAAQSYARQFSDGLAIREE